MKKYRYLKAFFEATEEDFEEQGEQNDELAQCCDHAKTCISKLEDCCNQLEDEDKEGACCCNECKSVLELLVTVCEHKDHTKILDDVIALVKKCIGDCCSFCEENGFDDCCDCLKELEECINNL